MDITVNKIAEVCHEVSLVIEPSKADSWNVHWSELPEHYKDFVTGSVSCVLVSESPFHPRLPGLVHEAVCRTMVKQGVINEYPKWENLSKHDQFCYLLFCNIVRTFYTEFWSENNPIANRNEIIQGN